jgi:streptomycin 6-kinase
LHHENILLKDNHWVAIDPKGVVGEIGYEIGVFIYNPIFELLKASNPKYIIANRIELFAKLLNIDSRRLCNLSYVTAVLSAIWFGEDAMTNAHNMLEVAEIIESLN